MTTMPVVNGLLSLSYRRYEASAGASALHFSSKEIPRRWNNLSWGCSPKALARRAGNPSEQSSRSVASDRVVARAGSLLLERPTADQTDTAESLKQEFLALGEQEYHAILDATSHPWRPGQLEEELAVEEYFHIKLIHKFFRDDCLADCRYMIDQNQLLAKYYVYLEQMGLQGVSSAKFSRAVTDFLNMTRHKCRFSKTRLMNRFCIVGLTHPSVPDEKKLLSSIGKANLKAEADQTLFAKAQKRAHNQQSAATEALLVRSKSSTAAPARVASKNATKR